MKRIVIITFLLLSTALIFSQAPQSINYQAVYKDASTSIYAKKTTVAVIVSILKDSPSGQEVFNEVHSTTLNETGLFTLEIGAVNIDDFVAIDWSDGPYFLKINVNGTDFGTSQILSVPYALYADSAGNVFSGEYGALANIPSTFTPETHSHTESDITDLTHYSDSDIDGSEAAFVGWDKDASDDFDGDMQNNRIVNVGDPADDLDAVNKAYADQLENRIISLENMLIDNGQYTVKDFDGNSYSTVRIGNQVWFAENLIVTHYNDGQSIPNITDNTEWENDALGGYCLYNNDSSVFAWSGALYNFYSLNSSKICPLGWHVPSNSEWTELIIFLGGQNEAGGKLKVTSSAWYPPNEGATNESGFSALPCGGRAPEGGFADFGFYGYFWTSDESDAETSLIKHLYYDQAVISGGPYDKHTGMSIRCIKD